MLCYAGVVVLQVLQTKYGQDILVSRFSRKIAASEAVRRGQWLDWVDGMVCACLAGAREGDSGNE